MLLLFYIKYLLSKETIPIKINMRIFFQTVSGRVTRLNSATFHAKVGLYL